MVNAVVFHIGVEDLEDFPNSWKLQRIVKTNLRLLKQYVEPFAKIYLGIHGTYDQEATIIQWCIDIGLGIEERMRYQNDLWEVPTLEWLHNDIAHREIHKDPNDIICYFHTKGITRQNDQFRDYLLDHMLLPYASNVQLLQESKPQIKAAVCCSFVDCEEPRRAAFWLSFWMAKCSYIRDTLNPPNRDKGRHASEEYMKIETGNFIPLDKHVFVYHNSQVKEADLITHPFDYCFHRGWTQSKNLNELKDVVDKEFKEHIQDEERQNNPTDQSNYTFLIVSGVIFGLLFVTIIFMYMFLTPPPVPS